MSLWFSHGYLISLVGTTLCATHTHTLAQTPMPCLPACRDRPPWLAKSKEVRVEKAGKWIIAKVRVMGFTIVIAQELLDYNLYIQIFKWDLQYMADISP